MPARRVTIHHLLPGHSRHPETATSQLLPPCLPASLLTIGPVSAASTTTALPFFANQLRCNNPSSTTHRDTRSSSSRRWGASRCPQGHAGDSNCFVGSHKLSVQACPSLLLSEGALPSTALSDDLAARPADATAVLLGSAAFPAAAACLAV